MTITPFSGVPTWTLVLIGVAIVLQLSVEIFALVKLFQTSDDRLVLGKKWPWVLIIVLINLIGAIVFLVAGRKPAAAVDPIAARAEDAPHENRAEHAADVLYGSRDGE